MSVGAVQDFLLLYFDHSPPKQHLQKRFLLTLPCCHAWNFAFIWNYPMYLSVLKLSTAEYASNAFNSKSVELTKKSAVVVAHVLQTTQNFDHFTLLFCRGQERNVPVQELWYKLTATVLSITPFIWRRFVVVLSGPCYKKQFFLQLATQHWDVALQIARKKFMFATAIVARKVERPSTFRNVAEQVACV